MAFQVTFSVGSWSVSSSSSSAADGIYDEWGEGKGEGLRGISGVFALASECERMHIFLAKASAVCLPTNHLHYLVVGAIVLLAL